MNLFRLLLLAAAVYLVSRLVRAALRSQARRDPPPPRPPGQRPAATYEPMARCAQCGAHSPQSLLSATGLCSHCRS